MDSSQRPRCDPSYGECECEKRSRHALHSSMRFRPHWCDCRRTTWPSERDLRSERPSCQHSGRGKIIQELVETVTRCCERDRSSACNHPILGKCDWFRHRPRLVDRMNEAGKLTFYYGVTELHRWFEHPSAHRVDKCAPTANLHKACRPRRSWRPTPCNLVVRKDPPQPLLCDRKSIFRKRSVASQFGSQRRQSESLGCCRQSRRSAAARPI